MKANAKQELLDTLKESNQSIICAIIRNYADDYDYEYEDGYDEKCFKLILKQNYSQEDYDTFLNNLNFEYDDGYGGQELYGTIWLTNNEWLERGEYDGAEWWEHKSLPTIPDNLKG